MHHWTTLCCIIEHTVYGILAAAQGSMDLKHCFCGNTECIFWERKAAAKQNASSARVRNTFPGAVARVSTMPMQNVSVP